MSWWDLGEGHGHRGDKLELHRITCPFCMESGNFETEHAAEKRKPDSSKTLHFDTLRCANCSGYVMALWSASEHSIGMRGLYDYKVLPWPLRLSSFPDHWPDAIGRYWLQAHRNINDENWDAAALMARSTLQLALREHAADGSTLYEEIDDLANKGDLPPLMQDWAHELRELGNISAHPRPGESGTHPNDARDIVEFVDYLLRYLYNLPHDIQRYRQRRGRESQSDQREE